MKLGDSAVLVRSRAQRARAAFDHRYLGVDHLFLAIDALDDEGLIRRFAAERSDLREAVRRVREAASGELYPDGDYLGPTLRAQRVMAEAERLAATVRPEGSPDHFVWAPHILLAILAEDHGVPARALATLSCDLTAMSESIRELILTEEWAEKAYRLAGTRERAWSSAYSAASPEQNIARLHQANGPPEARFEIVAGPNDGFTFAFTSSGEIAFEGEILGPPPGSGLGPKDVDDMEVEIGDHGIALTCEVTYWLNGAEVTGTHPLSDGDVVRVGMTEMMFIQRDITSTHAPADVRQQKQT